MRRYVSADEMSTDIGKARGRVSKISPGSRAMILRSDQGAREIQLNGTYTLEENALAGTRGENEVEP